MEIVWLNDSQIGYPYSVSIKNSLDIRLNTQILEYIAPKNVLQIKNVLKKMDVNKSSRHLLYHVQDATNGKKDQY